MVSNREPYVHTIREGKIECSRPTGGAVTALDPVMRACGGIWVAYGSGNADKKVVDKKNHIMVPTEDPSYTLRRIWLTKEEEAGYYLGFSNRALWPLCHIAYTRPEFIGSDWDYYVSVNEKFADAVLEEVGKKQAFVWVQDYHLTLLPKMLKERRPDLIVSHFWHIPWPNSEVFRICPKEKEVLEGLLANDILGFHIRYHCENFFDTVEKTLEARIDRERYSIIHQGHETLVRAFPISVDYNTLSERSDTPEVEKAMGELIDEYSLSNLDHLIFGLDRIDYTKGILERIRGIDKFLENNPEYKGKIAFIQMGDLSRIHLQQYKDLNDEINAVVEEINWKYSTEDWEPIIMVRRHLSFTDILAFYRLAKICVVSSLHDGMNIVAKEFISSRVDEDGVLLLSKFTGAARELPDAIYINPYDVDEFADKIKEAIEMPKAERKRRMIALRAIVEDRNIYKWAGTIISEFGKLQNGHKNSHSKQETKHLQ
ncbi:MAG: trehalose-6-phosphate synthase [Candidatus Omnitrophica bacterium]|nr:trehalose-6-phosphate synthase [Candidatus Omnitrophota bacterium]